MATANPLVWYEVKVNEPYFDFVVNNGYYDSRKQPKTGIGFPAGVNDAKGIGAIRVKAAWKVLGDAKSRFPDDPKRCYAVDALVFDALTEEGLAACHPERQGHRQSGTSVGGGALGAEPALGPSGMAALIGSTAVGCATPKGGGGPFPHGPCSQDDGCARH
ncbi:hypothetical protein ACLEPN_04700 [Myxococcus sp. 1LA]